jgi:hypothetical protein
VIVEDLGGSKNAGAALLNLIHFSLPATPQKLDHVVIATKCKTWS